MKLPFTLFALLACIAPLRAGTTTQSSENTSPSADSAATYSGSFLERSTLTGDWGGLRNDLATHGLTIDLEGIYTFQGVASGGARSGDSTGNLFNGDLAITLDTQKAGLWPGGFLKVRLDGRGGDNVQNGVGSIMPVNNYSLIPNVTGRFGDSAWAVSEISFTQFFSENFGVSAGLMNTISADANPIAGSMISNDHFLHTGFLYSPVEAAVAPTVTLGGSLIFVPAKNIQGVVGVIGSSETAGNNPFENYDGTTFTTEWAFKYEMGNHPGGMRIGALYSINRERADLNADARLFFGSALAGKALTTDSDAWAIYWNGYQYLQGDENQGWGFFGRVGFGDQNVNLVRFSFAAGLGGTSPISSREKDRWGLGLNYTDFANNSVLQTLRLDSELAAELFYNIALTPWAHLTLDAQIVDSPVSGVDTAVVLGTRLVIAF